MAKQKSKADAPKTKSVFERAAQVAHDVITHPVDAINSVMHPDDNSADDTAELTSDDKTPDLVPRNKKDFKAHPKFDKFKN